jgi:hypothetical protein
LFSVAWGSLWRGLPAGVCAREGHDPSSGDRQRNARRPLQNINTIENLTFRIMPRAVLRRIGNSFGLILPKDFVREQGLKEGDEVDVNVARAKRLPEMWGAFRERGVRTGDLNALTNEGEDVD